MSQFHVGDHVRTLANPEEGWPEETGIVLSVEMLSWGESIVISIDPEYREDDDDDGLREVTADQLELLPPTIDSDIIKRLIQ